jgi:hypothetical protein
MPRAAFIAALCVLLCPLIPMSDSAFVESHTSSIAYLSLAENIGLIIFTIRSLGSCHVILRRMPTLFLISSSRLIFLGSLRTYCAKLVGLGSMKPAGHSFLPSRSGRDACGGLMGLFPIRLLPDCCLLPDYLFFLPGP